MVEIMNEMVGIVVVLTTVVLSVVASTLLLIGIGHPVYFLAFLLLMIVSILILYVGMIRTPSMTLLPAKPMPSEEKKEVQALVPETTYVVAKLEMPNSKILPISSVQQSFGRKDFEQFLDQTAAMTISRNHFTIYFRGGKFFIEDQNSTNGTLLNGQEIRGTGPHEIKDGDIISPAGVISIKFRI
ncbi:MAG: FHA domain-containing protein [Thermoproteota archaeon]